MCFEIQEETAAREQTAEPLIDNIPDPLSTMSTKDKKVTVQIVSQFQSLTVGFAHSCCLWYYCNIVIG